MPFVCLKLRNSDQHQNFRPLWALSLSSMALTIIKYFQGANNSAPDWPLVCPSAQFLHVRLHLTIHTLSLAGITSEPCAGVFQWAHITASQKIDRTCCIYIYIMCMNVSWCSEYSWARHWGHMVHVISNKEPSNIIKHGKVPSWETVLKLVETSVL